MDLSNNEVKAKAYGISDIGLVRTNNEDAWFSSPHEGLFLIADGLGGHQSGEEASKESIDLFLQLFRTQQRAVGDAPLSTIRSIIRQSNLNIYQLSFSHDLLRGMGTTFIALYIHENQAYIGHVGDSRLYRYRPSRFELLTHDHLTPVQKTVGSKEGPIPLKGYLTKALGTQEDIDPEMIQTSIAIGDLLLLCTDGLSDMLSTKDIEEVLVLQLTVEQKVRMLVSMAKEKGGVDNITLILVEIISV